MSDIFDQLAPTPTSGTAGDVFDQITAPKAAPNPNLPPAVRLASVPVPGALKTYTPAELAQPSGQFNYRTGQQYTVGQQLARVPILDAPTQGVQTIGQGIAQMAEPGTADKLRGAGKVLTGAVDAASPAMAALGVTAPLDAAAWYALSKGLKGLGQAGGQAAGMNPADAAELGDVASAVPLVYGFGKIAADKFDAAIEAHNDQAAKLVAQDAQQGRGVDLGEHIAGPEIPLQGTQGWKVVPNGASGQGRPNYAVVDAAGKPLYAGNGREVRTWLSLKGVERTPITPEQPAQTAPAAAKPAGDVFDQAQSRTPAAAAAKPEAAPNPVTSTPAAGMTAPPPGDVFDGVAEPPVRPAALVPDETPETSLQRPTAPRPEAQSAPPAAAAVVESSTPKAPNSVTPQPVAGMPESPYERLRQMARRGDWANQGSRAPDMVAADLGVGAAEAKQLIARWWAERMRAPGTAEPAPSFQSPPGEQTEAGQAALRDRIGQGDGEPAYVRFGNLPKNSSQNEQSGEAEAGASVYPAVRLPDGGTILDLRGIDQAAFESVASRPAFEASGDVLEQKGSDGEPLLQNAKLGKRLERLSVLRRPGSPAPSRPAELVPYEDTLPSGGVGGYDDARRAAETEPGEVKQHPLGSWSVAPTGDRMQLREYDSDDPRLIFNEGEKRNPTVDKYADWIRAGHEPPPMSGMEMPDGRVNILSGNHRRAAIRATGGGRVKVWVEVPGGKPNPAAPQPAAGMPESAEIERYRALGEGLAKLQQPDAASIQPGDTVAWNKDPSVRAIVDRVENGKLYGHSDEPGDIRGGMYIGKAEDFSPHTGDVFDQVAPTPPKGVQELLTDKIHADPVRFQFKADTGGKSGTGDELKHIRTFDPNLAGVISVWHDPADGKTYVVNGHHRLELAQRTGQPVIGARYLEAATAGEARRTGALINIAEGRGTAIDAAKVFRESADTPESLEARGVSLRGEKARQGLALAQLAPQIFKRVVQGDLPVERAAILGEALPDHQEQQAALALLDKAEARGKRPTNAEVRELIDFVKNGPRENAAQNQTNLFGEAEIEKNAAWEKAEISDYIRKRLGQEKRIFASTGTARAAEQLGQAGNVIKPEENARIAQEAAQAQQIYDKLKTTTGPVNDVLDRAARQLVEGANGAQVKADAYERTRQALSEALAGRVGPHSERSEGTPESGSRVPGLPQSEAAARSAEPTGQDDSGIEPLFARVPELSAGRNDPYQLGQSKRYHLGRMRSEPIPLTGEEDQIASAHVVNAHLLEYLGRLFTLPADDAGKNMGGWHLSPGAELPALRHLLAGEARTLGGASLPEFARLRQIAFEAQKSGKSLVLVKDHAAYSQEERQAFLDQELNHARQRTLGALSKHLGAYATPFVSSPGGAKAKATLESKLGYQFQSDHVAAVEIGERLMRPGGWRELELTEAERDTLSSQYVQSLEQAYGQAAAKPLIERVRASQNDLSARSDTAPIRGPDRNGAADGSGSGNGPATPGETARIGKPDSDEREPSLFDADENDQVAETAARDRAQLEGERLSAQLNSPLTRDEQLKTLRRDKADKQGDFFREKDEDPQGSLFLGSGLGALQPFVERFIKQDLLPGAKQVGEVALAAKHDLQAILAPASIDAASRATALSVRKNAAELQRATDRAYAALRIASKYFDAQPAQANYAFIDAIENGSAQTSPELRKFADLMREMLDRRRDAIQALGTGKLRNFIENYFPHVWQDPKGAARAFENWGKRPLEGSKAFTKKRSIVTFADGVALGLKPISDNPVELVLAKVREMDKYLVAHQILNELKAQKLLTFVDAREGQAPAGWKKIEDPVATVYGQSVQQISEFPNEGLWGGLEQVAQALGIKHERGFLNLRGAVGRASQANGQINTLHGSAEDVVAHEIGHQIDWLAGSGKRFVLEYPDAQTVARLRQARKTLKDTTGTTLDQRRGARQELAALEDAIQNRKQFAAELRALADLRGGRPEYTHKREEKMAQLAEMWVGARQLFERTAPRVFALWKQFLDENPKLQALRDIEGSTEVRPIAQPYDVGGLVIKGHWWAPEAATRILNNYLSPGLREKSGLYRAYLSAANLMNQAQLGFSAFHLGFTTIDVATSKLALAIYQGAHGDVLEGLRSLAQAPISPITNILRGDKLLKEWYAPGTQGARIAELVDAMVAAGGRAGMDRFYQTQYAKAMAKAWRAGNVFGALARIPGAAMEAAAYPIMQYVVPRQKLGVFADLARYELERLGPHASDPDVQAALARAWDSVDNRLGQLVYDNLFWNKAVKDLAMASVRSVGWNLGTIREIAGAGPDAAKAATGKGDFTPRMGYAIALPIMAGLIGGTLYYLWHGHGPRHLKDYFFPTDSHGHRWSLPTYMKDLYEYGTDPVRTAQGKIHPLLQTMWEMLENKDFYDHAIRNHHHPLVKQAEELAAFAAKQFVPMAYRDKPHHHASVEERALGFVGVRPAPKSLDAR